MDAISDEVVQIIAKHLKLPLEQLTPESELQRLGAASLDVIEIIFELEEKFDISIPFNANELSSGSSAASGGDGPKVQTGLGGLRTIGEISAAVKELVDQKTAP